MGIVADRSRRKRCTIGCYQAAVGTVLNRRVVQTNRRVAGVRADSASTIVAVGFGRIESGAAGGGHSVAARAVLDRGTGRAGSDIRCAGAGNASAIAANVGA